MTRGFQTFLGPKFCADYENHSHFSVTSSVYKIFKKTGIPDFAYVVVSSESPFRSDFLKCHDISVKYIREHVCRDACE